MALAERLDGLPGVDGLELNLSCPNVAYSARNGTRNFAHDPVLTGEVVQAVRAVTDLPVIAKLGPDVADIAEIGRAAEAEGADALAVMNTIPGMVIDIDRRRPVLTNVTGGLSGPAIRPIAVRLTYQLVSAVNIPVIGIGGNSGLSRCAAVPVGRSVRGTDRDRHLHQPALRGGSAGGTGAIPRRSRSGTAQRADRGGATLSRKGATW